MKWNRIESSPVNPGPYLVAGYDHGTAAMWICCYCGDGKWKTFQKEDIQYWAKLPEFPTEIRQREK